MLVHLFYQLNILREKIMKKLSALIKENLEVIKVCLLCIIAICLIIQIIQTQLAPSSVYVRGGNIDAEVSGSVYVRGGQLDSAGDVFVEGGSIDADVSGSSVWISGGTVSTW
jgi:hypothetical protein